MTNPFEPTFRPAPRKPDEKAPPPAAAPREDRRSLFAIRFPGRFRNFKRLKGA
jgi:hypothetical protein